MTLALLREQLKQSESQASAGQASTAATQQFHANESNRLQLLLTETKLEMAESLAATNKEWSTKRNAIYARQITTEMLSKSLLKLTVAAEVGRKSCEITLRKVERELEEAQRELEEARSKLMSCKGNVHSEQPELAIVCHDELEPHVMDDGMMEASVYSDSSD